MNDLNVIVSLDAENLRTHDRRQSVAHDLYHAQIMPRDEAERLVELIWKDSQGEPMLPSLRQWCEDRRKLIEDFQKLENQRAEAWQEQAELDVLKVTRGTLAEKLAGLRGHLATAEAFVSADHAAGFDRHMQSGPPDGYPYGKMLWYARDLAGTRELVVLLKKTVIPALESKLSDADAALAAFQRQIDGAKGTSV